MLTTRSKHQAGVTAPPTTPSSSTADPAADSLSIPQRVRRYLPSGQTLSAEAFANRHKVLQWLLTTHLPALALLFYGQGYALSHTALELVPVALALALSRVGSRRSRSLVVTAGLLWSSVLLVHATDGRIEAHFHFFVMLAFVAMYQDWAPFFAYVAGTVLSHGVGSLLDPQSIFNHAAGQNNPWVWSLLHGAAVLLESVGLLIFTSNVEQEGLRVAELRAQAAVTDREVLAERRRLDDEAADRAAKSSLLVNLARRNQGLLARQLDQLDALERVEEDPSSLQELFRLDHLATRMRRNAESLLVLSGDKPQRRWSAPVPLAEVLRGAVAEIEDFVRVDIAVPPQVQVEGRVVADLVHLFAELLENATTFSPPSARVEVTCRRSPTGAVVAVRDGGIGLSDDELAQHSALLLLPEDAQLVVTGRLGFQVVGRLAARDGLGVALRHGRPGLVVEVDLPAPLLSAGLDQLADDDLVSAADAPAPAQPQMPPPEPDPVVPVAPPVALPPVPAAPADLADLADQPADIVSPRAASLDIFPGSAPPPLPLPRRAAPHVETSHRAPMDAGAEPLFAGLLQEVAAAPAVAPAAAPVMAVAMPAPVAATPAAAAPPPPAVPPPAAAPLPAHPPVPAIQVPQQTAGGLVRRVPQASLSPQLQGGGGREDGPSTLDPDQTRSTLSSFASGLAAGRAAATGRPE